MKLNFVLWLATYELFLFLADDVRGVRAVFCIVDSESNTVEAAVDLSTPI